MALRPWQAQKIFGTTANEVKAPISIAVVPKRKSFRISWQRRLGMVDGFIVLVGDSPGQLRDLVRISNEGKTEYAFDVMPLIDGREYFTTVIAFRGDARSEIAEVWKVIPNTDGLQRPAEKLSAEVISAITSAQSEVTTQPSQEGTSESQVENTPVAVVGSPQQRQEIVAICGSCSGDVILKSDLHLFVCSGCGAQYVQRAFDGKFIPINMLANGICECCDPRRPLIHPEGETFKKCSLSGEKYIEVENRFIRVSKLDYGFCSCCRPPCALILNVQGQVICCKKRENLYVREGDRFVQRMPEAPPSLVSDIDQALANGSAGMMPNGILTSGDNQSSTRTRRRPRT